MGKILQRRKFNQILNHTTIKEVVAEISNRFLDPAAAKIPWPLSVVLRYTPNFQLRAQVQRNLFLLFSMRFQCMLESSGVKQDKITEFGFL